MKKRNQNRKPKPQSIKIRAYTVQELIELGEKSNQIRLAELDEKKDNDTKEGKK